jgi:hypothetical protein
MLATLEETTTYVGPARVLAAGGNRAKLELPDQHVWAIVALGGFYRPAVDDVVLAIGQKGAWYVIGVIHGRGPTTLTVPGDLAIRAPRGGIELTAAKGVTVKSPDVTIAADRLELLARSVFERFTDATRWVKAAFQVRAGRVRTRVDGDYDLAADRILERAEHDVKIDGSKIHLG